MMYNKNTAHYTKERQKREDFIQNVIGGYGELVYQGYTRNKQKPYLSEVHNLYSNAIITVVNPYRGMDRIVTSKIARPNQVIVLCSLPKFLYMKKVFRDGKERLVPVFKNVSFEPPKEIIELSYLYVSNGWNHDDMIPDELEWNKLKLAIFNNKI